MKIKLICKHCKIEFETDYKFRDKKFCCRGCYFNDVKSGNTVNGRRKDLNIREFRTCKVCGDVFESKKLTKKEICSDDCRKSWGSRDDVKQYRLMKTKEAVQKKYGVDHVWMVKEIHKKTIDTTNKEESIKKQRETVRLKTLRNLEPKLTNNHIELLSEYTVNKTHSTGSSISYQFQCTICDHKFTSTLLGCGVIPRCTKCHPSHRDSKPQLFIQDFLNKNNINYIQNNRKIISPLEIDFYLPDHKIGIEVNGLYYHTESMGKGKDYHLNKSVMSNNVGVKLIQIFEDEIHNTGEIILSKLSNELKLSNMIKVDARKCEIKVVQPKEKISFLNDNHLQGNCVDTLRYGLYLKGELVSLMTFGKRKITRSNSITNWELIRFCNKNYHIVRGGFGKLLKHFKKNNESRELTTYADVRWSGLDPIKTIYHKNNFIFVGLTNPNYWYFKSSTGLRRYNRFTFRKSNLIKNGYDPNKTERDIMYERKFERVWDCGNLKFVLTI